MPIMVTTFCKDCSGFRPETDPVLVAARGPYTYAKCAKVKIIDPVSGADSYGYCAVARDLGGLCGPEAKLFTTADAQPAVADEPDPNYSIAPQPTIVKAW